MRRLIMWNLITLDGFFEGTEPWSLAFHETIYGDELERLSIDQLDAADALLFGRRTWEGMADYWSTAEDEVAGRMNAIAKVVVTRTGVDATRWPGTTVIGGDTVEEVRALKAAGERDLYVFGSADLAATLLEAGLFDEVRLAIAPVVLGSGHPLFARGVPAGPWRLLEARPLTTGGVLVRYEVGAGAASGLAVQPLRISP